MEDSVIDLWISRYTHVSNKSNKQVFEMPDMGEIVVAACS